VSKIDVNKDALFTLLGESMNMDELEELLIVAKAELDDIDEDEGLLKIELNDTNRPDLWSTVGLARALRSYRTATHPSYPWSSQSSDATDTDNRIVEVYANIEPYRPYVAAFAVTGVAIDEPSLLDLIQTQEKLCGNFGQKRKAIAMGVYRSDILEYPVRYRGADPDATRFIPLQEEREMSLREIIKEHPKGQEFGSIVESFPVFPFLEDANGDVLSFPPVINSAHLGAVEVGDENLFIEMTGTDIRSLLLAISIVACDLADLGHTILPVKTVYPYDTEFGREIVSPYYFQEGVSASIEDVRKMLGESLSEKQIGEAFNRMGLDFSESEQQKPGTKCYSVTVPPYRNDFLHPVDMIEDIMIGHGIQRFEPVLPAEFTAGRLSREEQFGRRVKSVMIGMQFQEMIYNYLGSHKNYIERMCIESDALVQIENPMTENYEFVRNSVLPSLLETESVSAHAVYPHATFEIGKVTLRDESDNQGSVTRNHLGFLESDGNVGLNEVSARVQAVFFYLNLEFDPAEVDDSRFIAGRCAAIIVEGEQVGVYGEMHPQVLTNWGIQMPCSACEINLDALLAAKDK
jgi:phenylalanyl-tRNA synthetase beta chain